MTVKSALLSDNKPPVNLFFDRLTTMDQGICSAVNIIYGWIMLQINPEVL